MLKARFPVLLTRAHGTFNMTSLDDAHASSDTRAIEDAESYDEEWETEDDWETVTEIYATEALRLRSRARDELMFDMDEAHDEDSMAELGDIIAIDCELVGVGERGERDAAARVSVVNVHGHCLMDEYVRPREEVTDWRTRESGLRPRHMSKGGSSAGARSGGAGLLTGGQRSRSRRRRSGSRSWCAGAWWSGTSWGAR